MSYCPECGSEVANHDTFCAYCGISLQVIIAPPVSEPPPPENSPKMGEPEKIQTSATLDKDPLKSNEIVEPKLDESVPATPPTPFILEDAAVPPIEEKVETPGDTAPQQLSPEWTKTAEQLTEKTEDFNIPAEEPKAEIPATFEEPFSETKEIDLAFEAVKIEAETANEEAQVPTIEPVDEYSQTIPYTPADYAKQELIEPETSEPLSAASEVDDDERLKAILDEIDHNFQSGKLALQTPAEPIEEKSEPLVTPVLAEEKQIDYAFSEVIADEQPIVAEKPIFNEPQEFSTVEETPIAEDSVSEEELPKSEAISTPVSNPFNENPVIDSEAKTLISGHLPGIPKFESSTETPISEVAGPGIPVNFDVPIIAAVQESPVSAETPKEVASETSSPIIDSEDKEGRSFTNPNIGYGDTDGRSKQKLKPLEEGTVLNNRYEVIRKIGGGGMGAVYLANDKNLGGVLRAVKEMVQSYIEDEQQEKAINDFKRESLLLTSLEHPGIPTIYDYFFDEKEGRFYLVMKYISGGDLAARLRAAPEGRIDEVSITDWAIQVSDVLDYLHNRQPPIVYRDLKPSNIMIDGNTGKLMIIDFGIARWVNKEEKGVTAVGTMGYAPPELFSGNVEPRSDIYSLGSTMFHLLTGADPQSNPLLIFDFNKNPRPRQINSSLSDQMEQILMRSVEYNSEQRFASAAEMRDELIRHLGNLKKGTVTFGVVSNVGAGQPLSNVPVFCGFCGQKIVATDMFCPFCGAQQPLVGQSQKLQQPPPAYIAPSVTAKLSVIGTHELEQTEYTLEKDNNLLGRRDPMSNIFPEVDMSKYDPQTKISRKHAKIRREGDLFMLEDLGSSNGTILIMSNNESIRLLPHQPHVLSHGDKLRLGDTTLRFTVG